MAAAALAASSVLTALALASQFGAATLTATSVLTVVAFVWRAGTLRPDVILVETGFTGPVSYIRDDPDLPDPDWLIGSGARELRVSFEDPPGTLRPGAGEQEIRVRMRVT